MKIDLYVLCWNEEMIIPYVMNYYQKYINSICVIDNMSDDRSLEILSKYPNVRVVQYDSGNQIRDDLYLNFKNQQWKDSRGKADYVIVCDMDEVVWMDGIIEYLTECKEKGITVIRPRMIELYRMELPRYSEDLLLHTTCKSTRNKRTFKPLVFDPNQIQEINYHIGGHNCYPTGNVRYLESGRLNYFHTKFVDVDLMVERKVLYKKRLSDVNRQFRWGSKYLDSIIKYIDYMRDKLEKAEDAEILINTYDDEIVSESVPVVRE